MKTALAFGVGLIVGLGIAWVIFNRYTLYVSQNQVNVVYRLNGVSGEINAFAIASEQSFADVKLRAVPSVE